MKPWELLLRRMWVLVRDVVLTGTGIFLVFKETFAPGPDWEGVLGVALAFTVPSIAEHVKAILPSSAADSLSRPSEQHGSSPSSPMQGGSGEHAEKPE